MRMQKRQAWENWGDAIANKHLGKCVKVCMTDIWVAENQNMMEKPEGKMCFIILCQNSFYVSGLPKKIDGASCLKVLTFVL